MAAGVAAIAFFNAFVPSSSLVGAPQFAAWQEPNPTGMTEKLVRATYSVCAATVVGRYRIALLMKPGHFGRRPLIAA